MCVSVIKLGRKTVKYSKVEMQQFSVVSTQAEAFVIAESLCEGCLERDMPIFFSVLHQSIDEFLA